jgi:aminopeptidase N
VELCWQQLRQANNMTDALAALQPLIDLGGVERERALTWTFDRWQSVPAMLDHWCAAQAKTGAGDAPELLHRLLRSHLFEFENATRVRAVFDEFVNNQGAIHRADGQGYQLLSEAIGVLVQINVGLAARLLKTFGNWRSFDAERQRLMKNYVQLMQNRPGLPLEFKTLVHDLGLT